MAYALYAAETGILARLHACGTVNALRGLLRELRDDGTLARMAAAGRGAVPSSSRAAQAAAGQAAAAAAVGSEEGEESEGSQNSAKVAPAGGAASRSGRKEAKRPRQALAAGQQPLLQHDQDSPALLPHPQPAGEQARGPAALPFPPPPPVPSAGQVAATLLGVLGEQPSSSADLGFYLAAFPMLPERDQSVHAGVVSNLAASSTVLGEWLRRTAAQLQDSHGA